MALVLADRVQQTGTANTTVSFTLSGSVTGYQSFAVVGNGNTTYYAATDGSGNWEVGIGTYSTTGPTLTRTTILSSSNSGSAVTLFGTVNVFVTYPSEKSVNLDGSGNVSALGTVSSGVWQGTAVAVGYGGTGVTTSTGSGSNVLSTSPTLVTPILGTPTSVTLTNATGLSLSTGVTGTLLEANGGTGTTTGYYGFKNRIINGAMVIDQRNAGASVTVTTSGQFAVDRFQSAATAGSKFSMQQNAGSVTPPAGFANYLGATSLSSYSVGSTDVFGLRQIVEGFNAADLAWGTANAQPITISFWVRSSLTGTFGLGLGNSGFSRAYAATYTINSANTWEYKTVTIAGDTTGTWLTTNGAGIQLTFGLGYGSSYSGTAGVWNAGSYFMPTGATSIVGTSGATFYITGVQLEKGSTATSFDYRPYGTELALCQRYYQIMGNEAAANIYMTGYITSSGSLSNILVFPVKMRTAPTGTVVGSWTASNVTGPTLPYISTQTAVLLAGGTVVGLGIIYNANSSSYLTFSSEL